MQAPLWAPKQKIGAIVEYIGTRNHFSIRKICPGCGRVGQEKSIAAGEDRLPSTRQQRPLNPRQLNLLACMKVCSLFAAATTITYA